MIWYGRSRTGSQIRAMVSNPELAQAYGISVRRLAAGTFITGTCLAGLGGVMVAPLVPVQPFMGLDYVLRTFFVLIVGGLGSVPGLLSGAAVIGGFDSIVSAVHERHQRLLRRAGALNSVSLAETPRHRCARLASLSLSRLCCRWFSASSGPISSASMASTPSRRSGSVFVGARPDSCRSDKDYSSVFRRISQVWRSLPFRIIC